MINPRRSRKLRLSSADVKIDVFKPASRKRQHNIHYHERTNSVLGNVIGYSREIHYNPTRSNPNMVMGSAARSYFLNKHLQITSTQRNSDERD